MGEYTFAGGLNDSNVVVGQYYAYGGTGYRAFEWQNGATSFLPAPNGGVYTSGDESEAADINNQGVIVGSYNQDMANGSAMIWSNNVGTMLPTLSGYSRSQANANNNSNEVVGFSANGNLLLSQAVMWVNGVPESLGSLPDLPYTDANAIDDNGDVVGSAEAYDDPSLSDAFLWENGTMYDLNSLIPANSNWHLTDAYAINDGEIAGYGYYGQSEQSFLLTLVPEPTTSMMLLAGAAALVCLRPTRQNITTR